MGCGCSSTDGHHVELSSQPARQFLNGQDEKDFLHSLTMNELKDKKLLLTYFNLLRNSSVEGQFDVSDQLLTLVRKKGLPQRYRWLVWRAITGWSTLYKPGAYERILTLEPDRKVAEAIEKDLDRTFPGWEAFDDFKKRELRTMLRAHAALFPSVGYVQGMNFIAGFLLFAAGEHADAAQDAFFMFVQIMVKYRASLLFCDGLPLLKLLSFQFRELLEQVFPDVHAHLDENFVTAEMYVTKWVLTLFTQTLPFSVTARIWDIMLCDGLDFIVMASLGAVKLLRPKILKSETEDIIELLTWHSQDPDATLSGEAIVNAAVGLQLPKIKGVGALETEAKHVIDISPKAHLPSSGFSYNDVEPPAQPVLAEDGFGTGAMMPGGHMQKGRAEALAALQRKWFVECAGEAESLQGAAMQLSAIRLDEGNLARLLPGGDLQDLSPPATFRRQPTHLGQPTVVDAPTQPSTARTERGAEPPPIGASLSIGEQLRRAELSPISHQAAVAMGRLQLQNGETGIGGAHDNFGWGMSPAYAEASGSASFDIDTQGMVTCLGPGGAFRGNAAVAVGVSIGIRHQTPNYDVNFDDVDEGLLDVSSSAYRQRLGRKRLKELRDRIAVDRGAPRSSMAMLNFDYTSQGNGGEIGIRPRPSSASGVGGERRASNQGYGDPHGDYGEYSQPALSMALVHRQQERYMNRGHSMGASSFRAKLPQGPMPTQFAADNTDSPRPQSARNRPSSSEGYGVPLSAREKTLRTGTPPTQTQSGSRGSRSGKWVSGNASNSFQLANRTFGRSGERFSDSAGTWESDEDLGTLDDGGWAAPAKQIGLYTEEGKPIVGSPFMREAWQTPRARSHAKSGWAN